MTSARAATTTLITTNHWLTDRDGAKGLIDLYERHYSCYQYKDGRKRNRCVGPGYRIVLTTLFYDAAFIWRKFKPMDDQTGINCSVFRNESQVKSSVLIAEAMEHAFARWPGERLYTYVNPRAIRSSNPGYCFKLCGWEVCGHTKARDLLILEYIA